LRIDQRETAEVHAIIPRRSVSNAKALVDDGFRAVIDDVASKENDREE